LFVAQTNKINNPLMKKQVTADQAFVRKVNTQTVLDAMRLYAPLSRADLSIRTGLNRSTISSIIVGLIQSGYVQETTYEDPKIGRPGMLLSFNPKGGSAIGIEVDVDFSNIILTNFNGEIIWRKQVFHPIDTPQPLILDESEALITEALEQSSLHDLRPLGIGVALPGLVDAQQGRLVYAPNLHWTNFPLRLMWISRFDLPVMVENEANCAALGEYFYGVAYDVENFILLNTGVGLGSGIMIDGQLFKGTSGFAGEVGHIVLYSGGKKCACGREGCWETYVSPGALVQQVTERLDRGMPSLIQTERKGRESLTVEMIIHAAKSGDKLALDAIKEVGAHLGVGIANLCNIFNPELVVLGGVLSLCSQWLIPEIQEILKRSILPPLRENIRIEPSKHGLDSTVLGAVAFVIDEVLRESLYNRQM
jgi:glucokinase-like ROK family protein